MRILVTGGAGFIGSHLIDRLMIQGHEVLCLDNFYTGDKRNILRWMEYPKFESIRHDITKPIELEVEQIYHLACPVSPVHYQFNPVKTIKTNVLGTLNMLELAKRVKARLLIASTSGVYGNPKVHPQSEDYRGNVNPTGIHSCYEEGKRIAETLALDYYRQHNVAIRVARIFNTYGPRMLENDGQEVSNFVVQALRHQSLTVCGDGLQSQSFCYVSDLVEGLIRLMNSRYIGPVNLGSPDEYTTLELAQAVRKLVNFHINYNIQVKFAPMPVDYPPRHCPDISRAKTWLNWEPKISLQKGLQVTVEDLRDRLDNAQMQEYETTPV